MPRNVRFRKQTLLGKLLKESCIISYKVEASVEGLVRRLSTKSGWTRFDGSSPAGTDRIGLGAKAFFTALTHEKVTRVIYVKRQ